MIIEKNKVVLVHYTLKEADASGQLIESTEGNEPLGYIQGIGMMIPDFEENLNGLKAGDEFAFAIEAAKAYGEYDNEAIVDLPKSIFEYEGKIPEELFVVGQMLPLQDQAGNPMDGIVVGVDKDSIKVDFNHPMAGVDLYFTGHIQSIREASPEELSHGHVHGTGGHHH